MCKCHKICYITFLLYSTNGRIDKKLYVLEFSNLSGTYNNETCLIYDTY